MKSKNWNEIKKKNEIRNQKYRFYQAKELKMIILKAKDYNKNYKDQRVIHFTIDIQWINLTLYYSQSISTYSSSYHASFVLQIAIATHMATCRGEPAQILVVHTMTVITIHTIAHTLVRTGLTIAMVAHVIKPMVNLNMDAVVVDTLHMSMVVMEALLLDSVVMTGVLLVRPLVILIARLASLPITNGSDLTLAIHIAPLVITFKDQHEENTLSAHRTDFVELAM